MRPSYLLGLGGSESRAGNRDTELANTSITPSWSRIHACMGAGGCGLVSLPLTWTFQEKTEAQQVLSKEASSHTWKVVLRVRKGRGKGAEERVESQF